MLQPAEFQFSATWLLRLADGTRKAVEGWGLQLLCKESRWRSDSLTVIETPKGVDSNLIVKNAYAKYNLSIGVGLSQVNGKVRRWLVHAI